MGDHTEYNLPFEIILILSDIPSRSFRSHLARYPIGSIVQLPHPKKNKLGPSCLPLTDNHD